MKNKLILVILILIVMLSIATVSMGFSVDMEMDKTKNLKVYDEVILTLNLSEKIEGASFKINYDTSSLKLLNKETENLYVSENNGQVACVYLDMQDKGTNTLKIKFKVLNIEKTNLDFSLDDAKFVVLGNENSYSGSNIEGISKTITIEKATDNDNNGNTNSGNTNNNNNSNINNNKKDNTIINSVLPKTGTNDIIFVFIGMTALIAIYYGIKLKNEN